MRAQAYIYMLWTIRRLKGEKKDKGKGVVELEETLGEDLPECLGPTKELTKGERVKVLMIQKVLSGRVSDLSLLEDLV